MICIKAENLFSIREDARRIPLNALFPRPVSIIYGIDQRSLVGRFPKGRNHAIGTRTHRANDPLSALLCSIPSARHRLWLCVETESGRDCIRLNFRLEFVSHTRPGAWNQKFWAEPNCGRVKRGWPQLNLEVRGNDRALAFYFARQRVNNAER